jgi:UDP-N-acetylglucosamine diphosphorylase/glucosamine-1-phosphate N-acetyltransferase
MERHLVVFEDDQVRQLHPLTLTRPAFDLVCGAVSLGEKLRLGLGQGARIRFHARDYLRSPEAEPVDSYSRIAAGKTVTLVNARLVWQDDLLASLDSTWIGKYVAGGAVAVARMPAEAAARLDGSIGLPLGSEVFSDLPAREITARLVEHPWDLIRYNGEELVRDLGRLAAPRVGAKPGAGVHLVNKDAIRVAAGVRLEPGVVLDASEGPISLAEEVVVMANACLRGPLHVGPKTVIKMGATIYGGTTIGPLCKIGGEVGDTIIHGHSNKQHHGFVGHSYIGEWVNLGAGTDTSDMKNNYSTVRVPVAGAEVDSGEMFVGVFLGDHSKSGIGTVMTSGTSIGVCCNLYGAGYPPKAVPSFTWGGGREFVEHRLQEALETARRVMARRGRALDGRSEAVLKRAFDLTAAERAAFLNKQH